MSWLSDIVSGVGEWDIFDASLWDKPAAGESSGFFDGFLGSIFSPQSLISGASALSSSFGSKGGALSFDDQMALINSQQGFSSAEAEKDRAFQQQLMEAKIAAEKEAAAEALAFERARQQYVSRLAAKQAQASAAHYGSGNVSSAYGALSGTVPAALRR